MPLARPLVLAALSPAVLAGCLLRAPAPPSADLPLFGDGYRAAGDPCRRGGESALTNRFLDHMADLAAVRADTGGREVARHEGYILFSVPRG